MSNNNFPFLVKTSITKIFTHPNQFKDEYHLLNDNAKEFSIIDTKKNEHDITDDKSSRENIENIPNKIEGTYNDDYNIIHVDEIIRKKLKYENFSHITSLRNQYKILESNSLQPQTYVMRDKTLESMGKLKTEITKISTGEKLQIYDSSVKDIIFEYRKYNGMVKTVFFNINDEKSEPESQDKFLGEYSQEKYKHRVYLIEKYLDIASDYIQIDVTRINDSLSDICMGCGDSLSSILQSDEGTIRCSNFNCQTEHNIIILHKLSKDSSRINVNNILEDESIDNFLRAFTRYQGLQSDYPPENLYEELDNYFINLGRKTGDEIKNLPLNSRGRRGDTDHKMLWMALSEIGHPEYYEDSNLIGNIYWGWDLPDVNKYKELIITHYNITQKVFYQIPLDERYRTSSLGTSYRLWRHLELVGHICDSSEFRIANNFDSLKIHNKLWRLMCEKSDNPDIYYIE